MKMERDECITIFRKHNLTENDVVNLVVQILGAKKAGSMIEIKGLPMQAYLDTNLDIIFQGGKRYMKLSSAIKDFVAS